MPRKSKRKTEEMERATDGEAGESIRAVVKDRNIDRSTLRRDINRKGRTGSENRSQQQQDQAGLPELQSVLALYGPEPAVLDMFYCHGDMIQKKKVYDKVMLLTRLKEEAVILVHEVKQHWEYMRSVAGKIDHLSSQLSEGITGQTWGYLFKIQEGAR
ncbi:hypothetical protein KUCAC02_016569 [Chaenocephalus aceratus]|nr:hypothetical protein KUCAC02_016569 [Chaenocephalus aceratus]